MKRRAVSTTIAVIAIIVILAVAAVAAYFLLTPSSSSQKTSITVGVVDSLTGNQAYGGKGTYWAYQIWASEVNASGGLMVQSLGKKLPVHLVFLDDQSDPSTDSALANRLVTQYHADVLLGPYGTTQNAAIVPSLAQTNIFYVSGVESNPAMFTGQGYAVGTQSPDVVTWGAMVGSMYCNAGIKTAYIIYASEYSVFPQSTIPAFENTFSKCGGQVVGDDGYSLSATNFLPAATKIASLNPDALVVLTSPPPSVALEQALASTGYKPKAVYNSWIGTSLPSFQSAVPNSAIQYWTGYLNWAPSINVTGINVGDNNAALLNAWVNTGAAKAVGYNIPNMNDVIAYAGACILGKIIQTSPSLQATDLLSTAHSLSGKITTLIGPWAINSNGGQIPNVEIGQVIPHGTGLSWAVVWPQNNTSYQQITYPIPP